MIKRITKNSDIKFCVNDDSKIAEKFIVKFYTIDKKNCITRTAEDCINESDKRYIKLNWSQLKVMQSGMLNYEGMNLSADVDYNDGVYNETFTRTTYYYIYTDSTADSGATVDGLNARVTDLEANLNSETSDRQSKDNQLFTSIEDLRVNGGKVQDVQVNGKSVVSNKIANIDITSKAEKSELTDEATARQTEDEKITSSLNDEVTRAKNAEGTITLNLNSETTNRVNADNTLKKSIDDEVKARTTANTTLLNTINSVDTRLKEIENKEIWDFGTY